MEHEASKAFFDSKISITRQYMIIQDVHRSSPLLQGGTSKKAPTRAETVKKIRNENVP